MTVASRCTPPRRRPSVRASTSSTTSWGTKRANRSRTRSRSIAPRTRCTASAATALRHQREQRVDDRQHVTGVERQLRGDQEDDPERRCASPIEEAAPDSADPSEPLPAPVSRRPASGAAAPSSTMSSTLTQPGTERSGRSRSTVAIALACTSGPVISGAVGVAWMSCSDVAVAPTTTILLWKKFGGSRCRMTDGEVDRRECVRRRRHSRSSWSPLTPPNSDGLTRCPIGHLRRDDGERLEIVDLVGHAAIDVAGIGRDQRRGRAWPPIWARIALALSGAEELDVAVVGVGRPAEHDACRWRC